MYHGVIKRKYLGPSRGLALFGGVGTGKTTALQCLSSMLGVPFLAVSALDAVYAHHGDAGIMDCMDRYTSTAVCIDDIGTERARHFGTEFPMGDLLARRYDLWQRRRVLTLLSGNLTADERLQRYGTRIVDRINEMCVTVPCVWPSFRKQASGFRVSVPDGLGATVTA
jgi:DNA replication protein DnaC